VFKDSEPYWCSDQQLNSVCTLLNLAERHWSEYFIRKIQGYNLRATQVSIVTPLVSNNLILIFYLCCIMGRVIWHFRVSWCLQIIKRIWTPLKPWDRQLSGMEYQMQHETRVITTFASNNLVSLGLDNNIKGLWAAFGFPLNPEADDWVGAC